MDTWLAIKTERNAGVHSLNSPGLPVTCPVFHPNPVWVAGMRSANQFLSFLSSFFNCCFVKVSVAWWLTICQSEAQTCLSEHQTSFHPVISHTFHDILTFSTSNFLFPPNTLSFFLSHTFPSFYSHLLFITAFLSHLPCLLIFHFQSAPQSFCSVQFLLNPLYWQECWMSCTTESIV